MLTITFLAATDATSLLAAALVALLGGGLITAVVAVRKAPVETAVELVTATTAHAGELRHDNTELRQLVDKLEGRVAELVEQLQQHRDDAESERERARQFREANAALVDEVDRLRLLCGEKGVTW